MANFLGNYDFSDQLERAHPSATTGDYANVLKSQTVFVYTGGAWVNSFSPIGTAGSSFEINDLIQTQQEINISDDPNSVAEPTIEHFVDGGFGKHEIKIPEAKTFGVTKGLVSKEDWDLLQTLGDNYEYYEIFEVVTSDTGTVTKPSQSIILLDRYAEGVDAIITELDSEGFPIDSAARDALGNVITTTFDADGHYDLSSTPISPSVALVYLIKIKAKYANNVTEDKIVNKIGVSEEHYSNPNPTPYAVGGIPKGETFLNRNMTNMWDRLLYPLTPTIYESLQFDKDYIETVHAEGRIHWDSTNRCLEIDSEVDGVSNQVGQENWIRVCNDTGSLITNGSVVYINGASLINNVPTISLARSDEYDTSRIIGVTTHDIATGDCGYVTSYGNVNDLDTSSYTAGDLVYLSDTVAGTYSHTKPVGGSFVVVVGVITRVDATNGRLFCYPKAQDYTVEVLKKLGWSTDSQSKPSLSFDDASRTLTLSTVGTEFHHYQDGVKYTKTSDSIQIPDEEGLFFIYYNLGTLQYIKNPNDGQVDVILRNNPTVAYIYWNADANKAEYVGNELHMFEMNPYTHAYLHFAFRARYLTGLAPNTISADASGNLATSAQFGVDAGMITDEDVPTMTPSVLSTTGLPIFYLSGTTSNPTLRGAINSGFSVTTTGTGRLAYNTISAGNWVLSEVSNNSYVLCHVIAVNDYRSNYRVIAFVGQNQYNTVTLAREGALTELGTLRSVGILPQEVKAIATFIFQTADSYSNAVKARIRSIETGVNYVDWRTTYLNSSGEAGGGGSTVTNEYSDDLFRIFDNTDVTKKLAFEVSPVTTGQTRTITVPDRNLDLDDPVFSSVVVGSATAVSAINVVHTDTIARQAGYNWLVNGKSVNALFLDAQGTLGRLRISRYNSAGSFVDTPFEMYNDTGMVYLNNGVTISGDVSGMSSDMIDDDIFGNIENATIFLSSLSRPNLAINSNFDFWQEGTSLSGVVGVQRTNDGGFTYSIGSTYSVSRQEFAVGQTSVPNGPKYYKRVEVSSIAGAGNFCVEVFRVEALEETAGKQVTFSVWLKADANKNISVEFQQRFGTGGSSDVNTIVKKQQIGTTWARYSFTATMPSISGKTIGTTPGRVGVALWFDAGSDKNSRTDSLGHQSGTFDMAQCKFEIGPTATDWEPYNLADELVKCQRYCEKSYNIEVAPGTATSMGAAHFGFVRTNVSGGLRFKTKKVYAPSISFWALDGTAGSLRDGDSETNRAATAAGIGENGWLWNNSTGATTGGQLGHFIARAYL